MDNIKFAKKMIERTYGLLSLPSVRSPQFVSLIRGTFQLVNVTTRVERATSKAKSMRITYDKGSSAYTDYDLNIGIPAWYCFQESLEEFCGRKLTQAETAAISLSLINGSAVHEGLHVAHSSRILSKDFDEQKKKEYSNYNLFNYLLNVTEDLKNESFLEDRISVSDLRDYVHVKNEVFFSEKSLRENLEKSKAEYKELEFDDYRKSIALQFLVMYKNIKRRPSLIKLLNDLRLPGVADILSQCCNPHADSVAFAGQLYRIFETSTASKKQMMDQIKEEVAQEIAKRIIKREMKEGKPALLKEIDNNERGPIPQTKEFDILVHPWKIFSDIYGEVDVPQSFGFMKKLLVSRQTLPAKSEPRTRGTMMLNTKIANIITDGKLFAQRGESISSMKKKQPEYVILCDFSGSMGGIIGTVNETIRKMSKEMVSAGIVHSVYGHTSVGGEHNVPALFHVFSYKVNGIIDTKHEERFDAVKRLHLCENFDGYIIPLAAKKFNKYATNKVLIVVSDGAPSGPNYRGDEAINHTKRAIEITRKLGIKVIALSLVNDVIEENDQIYGSKNNIDATSQAKLELGMQKIILGE